MYWVQFLWLSREEGGLPLLGLECRAVKHKVTLTFNLKPPPGCAFPLHLPLKQPGQLWAAAEPLIPALHARGPTRDPSGHGPAFNSVSGCFLGQLPSPPLPQQRSGSGPTRDPAEALEGGPAPQLEGWGQPWGKRILSRLPGEPFPIARTWSPRPGDRVSGP